MQGVQGCLGKDRGSTALQPVFAVPGATGKSKRKKNKKKVVYDQYLADSGSSSSSEVSVGKNGTSNTYELEEFTPGMDINILIQQTLQNVVQSVSLEDYDGLSQFSDYDLICFSAAVKHNTSILSLQIRYLDVSDTSLVPLCRGLENHPCIRALDLSGTRGGNATVRAVFRLVCINPNILFVRLDDTMVGAHDASEIRLATRYNALACPDPTSNPFHLGLLRRIGDMEEEEKKYRDQLSAHPWLFADSSGGGGGNIPSKKAKKVGFAEKVAKSRIGADICAQFMSGRCTYGSRCRYIHPEKSAALQNAITVSQYKMSHELDGDTRSAKSSAYSLGQGFRVRLQSRLRPVNFSLKKGAHISGVSTEDSRCSDSEVDDVSVSNNVQRYGLWVFSAVAMVCSGILVLAY